MKIFFDTEFTGLHKNTTLISIGLTSEDGKNSFYGEFSDYDINQCDEWINVNVIKNLQFPYHTTYIDRKNIDIFEKSIYGTTHLVKGKKDIVKSELELWLKLFDTVQLVSDVCHYDMVLFIDIFGDAWDIPENVAPVCYDINQDIAKWLNITDKLAFDANREKLLTIPPNTIDESSLRIMKHNSLYDAFIIKALFEKMKVRCL